MTAQSANESIGAEAAAEVALVVSRRKVMRSPHKRWVAIMGLLVASIHVASALAKTTGKRPARGDKRACAQYYYKAKENIQAGHLLDAKETLGRCARAVCGSFLQQECTTLYTQMENDVPSVVPVVLDAAETPGAAFEVRVDGELLTSKLDGIAIPVNPGWHEFTFSTEGSTFATQKILLAQGQRNRAISVSQRPANAKVAGAPKIIPTNKAPDRKNVAVQETDSDSEPAKVEPPFKRKLQAPESQSETIKSDSGASWGAYVLGGVGLVGAGGAALFTYWGRQDNNALRSSCAPDCNPASVHHIRMVYLAADVSGATGVAALVASTWLFLRSRSSGERSSKETARLRMVDLRPSASGAVAT